MGVDILNAKQVEWKPLQILAVAALVVADLRSLSSLGLDWCAYPMLTVPYLSKAGNISL